RAGCDRLSHHRLPAIRTGWLDRSLSPHRHIFRALAVPLPRAQGGWRAMSGPGATDQVPLLDVRQLEVVYHDVATAVQGVSIKVAPGSIVAMIGTNGAGKTTTLRAVSGFLPAEDVAVTDGT